MSFKQILVAIAVIAATVNVISSEPQQVQPADELLSEPGPDSSGSASRPDDGYELQKSMMVSSHQRSQRHAAASRQKRQTSNNGPCRYEWSNTGNSHGFRYTCYYARTTTPTTYVHTWRQAQQPGSWDYNYSYYQQPQRATPSTYNYNDRQWPSRAYNDRQWPSRAYNDRQWPSRAYNDRQWPSRAWTWDDYNNNQQRPWRPSNPGNNSNAGRNRGRGRGRGNRCGGRRENNRRVGRRRYGQ